MLKLGVGVASLLRLRILHGKFIQGQLAHTAHYAQEDETTIHLCCCLHRALIFFWLAPTSAHSPRLSQSFYFLQSGVGQ